MNQSQVKKKKIIDNSANVQKPAVAAKQKPVKSEIENIYPFSTPNETEILPDLHQHAVNLEKEHLSLQATLNNNREKYDEFIASLAVTLDERGVSNEEIVSLLNKLKYNPPNYE